MERAVGRDGRQDGKLTATYVPGRNTVVIKARVFIALESRALETAILALIELLICDMKVYSCMTA